MPLRGLDWNDDGPYRRATSDCIRTEVTDSLERLQTDYTDLYQVHRPESARTG